MNEESELLRRYVEEKSQAAFADLVRQHLGFVYHTALRCLDGDAHAAEEVAQAVFTDLARKAPRLVRHEVLAGWLHTSARYAALQHRRKEQRRRIHEMEAQTMQPIAQDPNASAEWDRLRPVIDDALHGLSARDRDAILLRFFEGKSFADMAVLLGLTEDGARLRLNRALDKVHGVLTRRGIRSTVGALEMVLSALPASAAPAHMAPAIVAAAIGAAKSAPASLVLLATLRSVGVPKAAGLAAAVVLMASVGVGVLSSDRRGSEPLVADPIPVPELPQAAPRMNALLSASSFPQEGSMAAGGLYGTYEGDISPEMAAQLDLDPSELLKLKALYLDMQGKLRALLNPTATVVREANRLVITYDFDPEDLQRLEEQFVRTVKERILDVPSAAAFSKLRENQAVGNTFATFSASYLPRRISTVESLKRKLLRRSQPMGLTVQISWTGTGASTLYDVTMRYQDPDRGRFGSSSTTMSPLPPATLLKRFFGDLVRQHRPEIMAEIHRTGSVRP